MTQKEKIHEVGMISAIISDAVLKSLYKKIQGNGHGFIATVDEISLWAQEFLKTYKNTDWEKVLDGDYLKPKSKKMKSIICWDDAVIDFAYHKLEKFV